MKNFGKYVAVAAAGASLAALVGVAPPARAADDLWGGIGVGPDGHWSLFWNASKSAAHDSATWPRAVRTVTGRCCSTSAVHSPLTAAGSVLRRALPCKRPKTTHCSISPAPTPGSSPRTATTVAARARSHGGHGRNGWAGAFIVVSVNHSRRHGDDAAVRECTVLGDQIGELFGAPVVPIRLPRPCLRCARAPTSPPR